MSDKKRELRVIDLDTQKVVHRVDVSSKTDNGVERVMRGMLINMNRDRYVVADSADEDI